MKNIRSYKELRVYQAAIDAAMRIFEITKRFPLEERFSMGRSDASRFTVGLLKHRRSMAQTPLSRSFR
jgi:23S rRNA-intervening sequence protein